MLFSPIHGFTILCVGSRSQMFATALAGFVVSCSLLMGLQYIEPVQLATVDVAPCVCEPAWPPIAPGILWLSQLPTRQLVGGTAAAFVLVIFVFGLCAG